MLNLFAIVKLLACLYWHVDILNVRQNIDIIDIVHDNECEKI